jgi:uncharacterized protein YecE (DUF72 family)
VEKESKLLGIIYVFSEEALWNMLKHYNISVQMIDPLPTDNLGFMSGVTVTTNHSFVKFHGRDSKHRYNYLYSKEELKPWASKVKMLQKDTPVISLISTIIMELRLY